MYSNFIYCRAAQASEETAPDEQASEDNSHTELSILEKDCCKQNFTFYDKAKQGFVERFELPMVLTSKFLNLVWPNFLIAACGYNLSDQRIEQLNTFLDEKSAQKVDLPILMMTLTYLKELEL